MTSPRKGMVTLAEAAQAVLDRWTRGDLAEAVRELDSALQDYRLSAGPDQQELDQDDLAELLEGVPLRAEILVLAPGNENLAYRIISARVSNPRARRHRPALLYLVLETQGHPVSRLRLLRRRPFRP